MKRRRVLKLTRAARLGLRRARRPRVCGASRGGQQALMAVQVLLHLLQAAVDHDVEQAEREEGQDAGCHRPGKADMYC